MKCSVPGCDTDENIVSFTSAFFVNFPVEPSVQEEWLLMLSITDAEVVQALLAGQAKVCSCHFAEQCFEQHPVYGYRFLLPRALPTILPGRQIDEFPPQPPLLPCDGDTPSSYYFMYVSDGSETPALSPAALSEMGNDFDLGPMDTSKLVTADDSDEEDAVEEIGIDYADGKYYFLRLEKETEPVLGVPETITETHEPDDPDSWKNLIAAANDLPEKDIDEGTNDEPPVDDDEYLAEDEVIFEENMKPEHNHELELADRELEPLLETMDKLEDELEHASANASGEEFLDDEESEPPESPIEEAIGSPVPAESDSGAEDEAIDYGSIEALDEVSVRGGQVRVRARNERVDRHFCTECGKGFPYPSALTKHMLTHTKQKPHTCEECGRGFAQKVNLDVHMRRHNGERPAHRFVCKLCGRKCYRRSQFIAHLEVHRRNYPLECPACDSRFATITMLYRHIRQDHYKEITMQQALEAIAESTKAEIIVGRRDDARSDTQSGDGHWECGVCGKRFMKQMKLRKHKRTVHPKIFPCQYCERSFPYRSMLEKHLPVHTLEKPFRCTQCSASFTQRCNLTKHVQCKHSVNVLVGIDADDVVAEDLPDWKRGMHHCARCNKTFCRTSTWMAHLESHRSSNNPQPTCELCDLTFASKSSLGNHNRWQHGTGGRDGLSGEKLRDSFLDDVLLEEANDEFPNSSPED